MKYPTLFLLLTLPFGLFAQGEPIQLGHAWKEQRILLRGTEFRLVIGKPADSDFYQKDSVAFLFRGEKQLLAHPLWQHWSDCNSLSIEIGSMEFGDSTITFYSSWMVGGDMMTSPWGARRQVYVVKPDGKVTYDAKQSTFWDGRTERDYANLTGSTENEAELREERQKLMTGAQKEFLASFVYGAAAKDLIKEVYAKMPDLYRQAEKDMEPYCKGPFGCWKMK